jgi:hypothetical protein
MFASLSLVRELEVAQQETLGHSELLLSQLGFSNHNTARHIPVQSRECGHEEIFLFVSYEPLSSKQGPVPPFAKFHEARMPQGEA